MTERLGIFGRTWPQLAALVLSVAVTACGCDKARSTTSTKPGRTAKLPATRPSEIPAANVPTLATYADRKSAEVVTADLAVRKAVDKYLANPGQRWQIGAARNVGDYILLWINFPGIADGGIDLVYSTKYQAIGWQFHGGWRG